MILYTMPRSLGVQCHEMDGTNRQPVFPKLQISDLLVLTMCVGLTLGLSSPRIREALAQSETDLSVAKWRLVVPRATDSAAFGISLFGLIVLYRQRLRGICPMSPGHWVFIATGPFAFTRLVTGAWREV